MSTFHENEDCSAEEACGCWRNGYDHAGGEIESKEEAIREELDSLKAAARAVLPPWSQDESLEWHALRMAVEE